jgi:hypothetical protein
MKSLFVKEDYNEILSRLQNLKKDSPRQWGKMSAAQMLAHCSEAFKVPLSDQPHPRMFMGILLGWMMKSKLYNDSPWRKNLPTAPNFIIKDEKDFDTEKNKLLSFVEQFHQEGKTKAARYPHPFFGRFTTEQWGKSMYKHLDHHLKQFNN